MLRARLFGELVVEVDGREVPHVPGLKPRALLAYLLLHPWRHGRERLAGLFWPDVLDTSARASLRNALSLVRGALESVGGQEYLDSDRVSVGVAAELPRWVDAEEFSRLIGAGDAPSLEQAVDLARAPLLADLTDDWAITAQEEHARELVDALERLADEADRAGDLVAATTWTRRALDRDHLREGSHRALMRRLAAMGERAQALAAYRRCRAVLAAELGIPPSAETRALAERLRGGEVDQVPAAPVRVRHRVAGVPHAMVGRDSELATLRQAWEAAAFGRGGVALVSGPAGIGKTRLVAELTEVAMSGGARVACGAGLELAGGPPLGPWSEILRGLVDHAASPPEGLGWPGDIARLCPVVESRWMCAPGPVSAVPEVERSRLFEAIVEMVAWCSREGPVLLVLEDLHWADPATLAVLAYLGRRLPDLPVLALVTRREALTNVDLDLAVDGLARRGAVRTELRLGPLAGDMLAAVALAAVPGLHAAAAAQAATAGDGNPFLVQTAARALATGTDPARGLIGRVRGPLGHLSTQARMLVDLVAAAGRPLSLGEAADLAGAEAVSDAFAEGLAAELFEPTEARRIRFVHELVREACYAELSLPRRRWLHGRLAATLSSRPNRVPAEIARHLRLAGDDAAALPYLDAAATRARALGALHEAAAFLREAAELAREDPLAEAEFTLRLGEVAAWQGDRDEVDAVFARARELLEEFGDITGLAGAYAARGRWLRGTICYPRESLAAYQEAIRLLDVAGEEAPELRAVALAGAAWAEALAGDPARAERLIADAEAVPEASNDPLLTAELCLARAAALMRAGRFAEAEEPSTEAAALAEACGRPDLAVGAWDTIAAAAASRGDFERALDLATRGLASSGASLSLQADIHAARAYALSRLGRHEEAQMAAAEEADVAGRLGLAEHDATAHFDQGSVFLFAGDPAAAAEHLRAALIVTTRKFSRPLARLRLAEALVRAGSPRDASEELHRVPFEPVGPADLPATLVARLARIQGLVAAAEGDHETALRRLDEAEAGWRRIGTDVAGEAYAATITDLGRPPVAGLVEPEVELGRVIADRAVVLAMARRPRESARAARDATVIADRLRFDEYRDRLAALADTRLSPSEDRSVA